MMKNFEHYYW